jgi:hypothetical protein
VAFIYLFIYLSLYTKIILPTTKNRFISDKHAVVDFDLQLVTPFIDNVCIICRNVVFSAGCCGGPGYATPLDAMKLGPREKIVYVPCITPTHRKKDNADYLATIDVDPSSPTFSKVS